MDPLSIATTILTLGAVVTELNKITTRYANASRTLILIQHDCDQTLTLLHHFAGLMEQRRNLVPPTVDSNDFLRLQSLLLKSCIELTEDINKLCEQIEGFTTCDTRGDLLLNHVKLLIKLRSLEQSHTAISKRLKEFQDQKSSWDSDNIMTLQKRLSEPHIAYSRPSESREVCTRTSSTSAQSSPAILDPRVRESRKKSLLDAVRAGSSEAVRRILNYPGVDLNDSSTFDEGSPIIQLAVSAGRTGMVELLLQHNADISSQNSEGMTALHIAALNKADDMVEFLLQHNADPQVPDDEGHTPLWHGARGKCSNRSFQALLRAHNHDGLDEPCGKPDGKLPTPLWAAAIGGHLDRASNLLRQGASVDIRDKKGRTLLHQTEWPISAALTDKLLKYGADPWALDYINKKLPLHRASEQGRMDIATKLLSAMDEQRPNSRDQIPNLQDKQGYTPLMCAALGGYLPLVVHLVQEWKADITLQEDHGNDGFYLACARGHSTVAICLLGAGASVTRVNKEGNSPLHIAATHGHEETVRLLLSLGADANAKSKTIRSNWNLQRAGESEEFQRLVTPGEAAQLSGHTMISDVIDRFKQKDLYLR
ncbi:hypothetical protein FSARC_14146 [Fusarium sarcochroum]|uniref:Ankyrin repeat protein n=1 Tax=Fusarium sarcochroum TaxID=1208366 RepID=A0A8H4SW00_9HYPO|nr:hypothetical protein FSARC_14146 [Fusarium sarcochroum]